MSVSATIESRVSASLNTYFETFNSLNSLLADKLNSFLGAPTGDAHIITRRTALITARQLEDVFKTRLHQAIKYAIIQALFFPPL